MSSRRYVRQIMARDVVVVAVVAVAAAAGIVGLGRWLAPTGRPPPHAASASDPDDAPPGAVLCPHTPGPAPSASELIDCSDLYDGSVIVYTGEVIETVVQRADRDVVVINDDAYAREGPLPQTHRTLGGNSGITVILPDGFADELEVLGSYRARGDLVRIEGRYTGASAALGGEPAIDATSATVVRRGEPIVHAVPRRLVLTALLFAVAALAITWLGYRARQP